MDSIKDWQKHLPTNQSFTIKKLVATLVLQHHGAYPGFSFSLIGTERLSVELELGPRMQFVLQNLSPSKTAQKGGEFKTKPAVPFAQEPHQEPCH